MSETSDRLRITSWFGERDRVDGRALADELAEIYARHRLQTAIVLRARSGFGAKHHLESEALEVLSLDLPLVSIAMDVPERIEPALRDIVTAQPEGMITIEGVHGLHDQLVRSRFSHEAPRRTVCSDVGERLELTVHVGRRERTVDGEPAWRTVVGVLHDHGVLGATALLGIDGTVHGTRARARFLSRNTDVPVMIVAVGDAGPLTDAIAAIGQRIQRPRCTLCPVQILRRDGRTLDRLEGPVDVDEHGTAVWEELRVVGSLHDRHDGRPVHDELVRRIRDAGGAGATTLQGFWGYHGDHAPHGDRVLQIQRHVPLITTVVDRPSVIRTIHDNVLPLTDTTGLMTCATLSARHAGPQDGDRRDLLRDLHRPRHDARSEKGVDDAA